MKLETSGRAFPVKHAAVVSFCEAVPWYNGCVCPKIFGGSVYTIATYDHPNEGRTGEGKRWSFMFSESFLTSTSNLRCLHSFA